ncbi:hypothetical protein [Pseudoduganella sp. R-34]|uniref:hypothetical protein n=1 Tax=Pseudoduganella sp. R-34 TaxID=3404062 RepID=UPI003CF23782
MSPFRAVATIVGRPQSLLLRFILTDEIDKQILLRTLEVLMKLAAQLCPALAFFVLGRYGAGLLAMLLQFSIVGWIPASEWALRSIEDVFDQERLQRELNRRYQNRTARRI